MHSESLLLVQVHDPEFAPSVDVIVNETLPVIAEMTRLHICPMTLGYVSASANVHSCPSKLQQIPDATPVLGSRIHVLCEVEAFRKRGLYLRRRFR